VIGEKNVLKLMCYSRNTYYVWKREKRPIIELIDKYFEDFEITEFLETGKIEKFEKLNFLYEQVIVKNSKIYLDSFSSNFNYLKLSTSHSIFVDFYFYFLFKLKENENLFKEQFNNLLNALLHDYLMNKYIRTISDEENIKKLIEQFKKEFKEINISININSNFVEQSDFDVRNEILNQFKRQNDSDLRDIQKHLHCFKLWTDDMMMYLDYILKNNLEIFLDSGNEELIYHAIGFNIYLNFPNETPLYKLDLISIINQIVIKDYNKKEKITIDKIMELATENLAMLKYNYKNKFDELDKYRFDSDKI
jgi:hypothetical protein